MSAMWAEKKSTALYKRLSRDNDLAGGSNSVINQKKYLEGYAADHGYGNCVHYITPKKAVQEMERCVTQMGFSGAVISGHYHDLPYDDELTS